MEQKGLYNYLLILVLTAFALPLLVTFIPVNDKELHGVTEPLNNRPFRRRAGLAAIFKKASSLTLILA